MLRDRSQHTLLVLVTLGVSLLAFYLLINARVADPTTGQERYDQMAGSLDSAHTQEQTFIAARDGFSAVEVFPLVPPGRLNPAHTVRLTLFEATGGQLIAEAQVSLRQAREQKRLLLSFPAQTYSRGRLYRLVVESDAPPDTITLLSSSDDAYFDGELLVSGEPTGRDMAFRTYTALSPAWLANKLSTAAPQYAVLLLVTALFGLAGAAALTLFDAWPPADSFGEKGLWAIGCGVVLTPVLYLLAGKYSGWAWAGLLALAAGAWAARQRTTRPHHPLPEQQRSQQHATEDWALPVLFLWVLAVRVLQIQDMPAPAWVDGLSHVEMVHSILEAGRMPGGLLYHVGFHTQIALIQQTAGWFWTDAESPSASARVIVLLGQWISALTGLMLYLLVRRLWAAEAPAGDRFARTAGLLAAVVLSTLPSLPGYLINWGRYPFLLGLTLLPLTLSATIDTLRRPPSLNCLRQYLFLLGLLAGQFLSHYGTASFWLSFTILWLVVQRPTWLVPARIRQIGTALLIMFGLAVLVITLRFGDDLFIKLTGAIAESRQVSEEFHYATLWQLNLRAGGVWLLIGAGVALIWAANRAQHLFWLTAGWFLAQAALIALQAPWLGYALASYQNLLLALPLPLAALAGGLAAGLAGRLPACRPFWRFAPIVLLAAAGGWSQVGILNPASLTYSPADAQAMAWVREHTPPGARFLINSRPWSGGKVIPADGGGWLPTMTGRSVEHLEHPQADAGLEEVLRDRRIGYIYLGRFSGTLQRSWFESDQYSLVYRQGGIEIYAVSKSSP